MSLAQDALERRRQRDQSRRNALKWERQRNAIAKRIAARDGIVETPYGALVGSADPTGIRSSHLCEVRRYLIFTGGCFGSGRIFQAEEIDNIILKFARGVWLNADGRPAYHDRDGKVLRSVMSAAGADIGFSILAEAKAHLAQLQQGA